MSPDLQRHRVLSFLWKPCGDILDVVPMIRERRCLIPFFGVLSLIGCEQSRSNEAYNEVVSKIPEDLNVYFPNYLPGETFFLNFNEIPYSRDGYAKPTYYYLQCEISNIDSMIFETRSKSIGEYLFSDSCNIVIYKYQNKRSYYSTEGQEWRYNEWINRLKDCHDNYPIPNFLGLEETDYIPGIGLTDDYNVYVLKSDNRRVFDDKYYGSKVIMPENWSTGYSSGVCINERRKRVVYWIVIW